LRPRWSMLKKNAIHYELSDYAPHHMDGVALAIAATNDEAVNHAVYADAQARGIAVNVVDQPALCDVIFPAMVRRGPIQIAISTAGVSPVVARMIKQRIERMLPWILSALTDYIRDRRDRVKSTLDTIQEKRLFWQQIVEGPVAEEVLEGNLKRADALFNAHLQAEAENRHHAALYLVGAGPGHPDLITVKAARVLGLADVVLYDRLVAPELLERYARREAEKICVGKSRDHHLVTQEAIDGLIEEHLSRGHIVVRLKGGDPGIFAHGAEEIAIAKKLGAPYQIIPGVSAANGCAAYAGIPLTERAGAQSLRFLTLYTETLHDSAFWQSLSFAQHETLVFYMTTKHRAVLCEKLIAAGLSPATPIIAIEQGTTPYQRESQATLEDFATLYVDHAFSSPTLIIVGDVVRWRQDQQWREQAAEHFSFFPPVQEGLDHAIH